jgi:hypothetical protein
MRRLLESGRAIAFCDKFIHVARMSFQLLKDPPKEKERNVCVAPGERT